MHKESSNPSHEPPEKSEQGTVMREWERQPIRRDRITGCLLGGALGDALGYPVEFAKLSEIRSRYGPGGLQDFSPYEVGLISDDTQMTLFTAEGLIRAAVCRRDKGACNVPGVVHHAYLRWLHTQGEKVAVPAKPGLYFDNKPDGWLVTVDELHARRAPGMTCLAALHSGTMGTVSEPANDSKGCGGIMRIAPAGLIGGPDPFVLGCELAAITHGHPTGYLAAGFLAQLIDDVAHGISRAEAIEHASVKLREVKDHEECLRAVGKAVALAENGEPSAEKVESLGEGWVAEEALSISLYCALVAQEFADGVRLAVNHSGDSDSTGAITGNILGAWLGIRAIPADWLQKLELREVIEQIAGDLHEITFGDVEVQAYRERYPGW